MTAERAGKDRDRPPGYDSVTSAPPDGRLTRAQAFATHVEPEIAVLLRVARTVTGSWADAEDLVQDTLVRAYRGIDRFDGAHPRAWLLTILRNTNLNAHRRQRPALAAKPGDLDGHRPAFGVASAPSPEQTLIDRALDDDLACAVAALEPKFRTVLLLIDVDQLSYAEAATVLGLPAGTVMSRLSRARDRVRRHLRASRAQPRSR